MQVELLDYTQDPEYKIGLFSAECYDSKKDRESCIRIGRPPTNKINKEIIEEKVSKTDNGCWEWRCGKPTRTGYPSMDFNGKAEMLHRVSFEIYHRKLEEGECVLHKCDNRLCINPDHLFAGSKGDNNRDRAAKGRSTKGEDCHLSKLTEDIVREIHDAMGSYRGIGRKYGIDCGTVKQIKTEVTWKHLWN